MERLKLKIAVYAILVKDGKVLMGRRFKTGWQDGNYGLPSGHLEAGETLVEALIRETFEETGISLKKEDVQFVHVMHRKLIYIDFFFYADHFEGEPKIMEPDKCDDWNWFPLKTLPENTIPSVRSAVENYQNGIPFSEFLLRE